MPLAMPLALTLIAVLLAAPFSKWLGRDAGWPLAALYLLTAAALTPAALAVWSGQTPTWSVPWVPSLGVELSLRADGIGIIFGMIALIIGAVVFAYSTRYLEPGPQLSFYLTMTAFTFSMLGLVLTDDLLVLFICWELTSIASFLLIARSGNAGESASMRTLLVTFVGGLSLLTAVAAIIVTCGTTSVSTALADPIWRSDPTFTTTVAVLVLIAGFTKSAQFPFHVWLPDAMAAITPVSAYLHAAAVVKAGIFLLMRFSPAFHANAAWNVCLIVTGLFTAALGAWFALQQTDLKKLMAYSTVSQLGLIVAAVGVGTQVALAAALIHTIAHALFKSGLFMMVGVIDHATGTRDLRRMPQLYKALPGAFAVTAVGAASMAGIPPLLGFVSKESLFTAFLDAPGPAWTGWAAMIAAAAASVLTFAYCTKLLFGGFVDGTSTRSVHAPPLRMTLAPALPILAGIPLGLAAGTLNDVVGAGTYAAIPTHTPHVHFSLWHGITPELIATAVVFTLGGVVIANRKRIWPALEHPTFSRDGAAVIALAHKLVAVIGGPIARATAVDYPSRHITPLVLSFSALILGGATAISLTSGFTASTPGQGQAIDLILLALIGCAVLMVCRAQSRIGATVSLSAVGILATVQLLILGAPDVALTQLLVESLTVVVIMLVLQKLPRTFGRPRPRRISWNGVVAIVTGIAAGVGVYALNGHRDRSEVAHWYIDNTTEISGGNNIVNVILVEFRALDTLGELTVLGMAGVAIIAVFSTVRSRHLDPSGSQDRGHVDLPQPALRAPGSTAYRAIRQSWSNMLPLQLMLRILIPVLMALSAAIFWRGHNAPGGGFIAALVGSAIIGLMYLSTSRDRQIGPPRLPLYLIGGGVITAVSTGIWGLLVGSFLEPQPGHLGDIHLSSSMVFDIGVYMAVLGLIMVAFNLLGTSESSAEGTRERTDEAVYGELSGPMDTVRGEHPRVGVGTTFLSSNQPPRELGR